MIRSRRICQHWIITHSTANGAPVGVLFPRAVFQCFFANTTWKFEAIREETGAEEFTLKRVCVYSVTGRNRVNSTGAETFGVLYCAEITSFGELKSEIAEIVLLEELPERWTYPEIQPALIAEAKRRGAIT